MLTRDLLPINRNRTVARRDVGVDHPFHSLQREMNEVFDTFWRRFDLPATLRDNGKMGVNVPKIDIVDKEKEAQVVAEMPGLEEKDIDVTFADGVLTIRGERKAETEDKANGDSYYLRERSYTAFERAVAIDFPVKEDKVKANFKNGLLTVTLPKTEEAKSKVKRIPVSA